MNNLKKEEIQKKLIQLSWPLFIANNAINGAAMLDMFFIGRLGISQLAAMSISALILSIYLNVQGGMMSGAIAVVSRFLGGNRHSELSDAAAQIIIFAFTAASLFSLIIFVFMEPIFTFFGAQGETLAHASAYLPFMLLSLMAMSVFFMFVAIIRGSGDSITPLKLMGLASIIIAALDPFLIFGIGIFPAFGIKGAAIANLSAYIIVDIIAYLMLLKGKNGIKLTPKNFRPDITIISKFARIAIPAMGQGLLDRGSYMIILKIISSYGDPFIAAFGVVNNLTIFLKRFGWPLGNSSGIIVGHILGAGKRENIHYTVMTALKLYTFITVFLSITFFIFAGPIISIFTKNPEAIMHGTLFLKIYSPSFVIMGLGIIMFTTFNSAGATGIPLIVNLIAMYAVQIPLALILPQFIGSQGIFWAISITMVVHGTVAYLLYRQGKWMDKKI